jgi:hypothetical protein
VPGYTVLSARRAPRVKAWTFCKSKRSVTMHRRPPTWILSWGSPWGSQLGLNHVNYLVRQFSLPNLEVFAVINNRISMNKTALAHPGAVSYATRRDVDALPLAPHP